MDVFHVKPEQEIAVVRKDLLFRFSLSPAHDDQVQIWFQVPARDDDGEMQPVDTVESVTVAIGEVHETGYEGLDEGEEVEGDVEIRVTSFEGETFRVEVAAPHDWVIVAAPDDLEA